VQGVATVIDDASAPRTSSALGSYQPALDGMRAVAMSVMLAYHGELEWAKGAFLGLSQFFTLSGFLITSILLKQRARTGTVQLGRFWTQRYRRLMPAALLTLAGIVVFGATVADPTQVREIPGQVAASAGQVANWYFIFTDKSYIDLFAAPSPVQHFWSLAVEEQFYIIMPLVFLALIRLTKSLKVLAIFFAAGALASTAWMIWLYNHGASLDRLYYGTDTRAAELLTGGLLAVVLHRFPLNLSVVGHKVVVVLGLVAFGLTIWGWTHLELADGPVWRGGFLVISVVSCALIVSILAGGPLTVLLAWGFLPAMGRITYGLYLFHWPIFLWLTEEQTGLDSWYLFSLRMAVTFAVAIASYNLMEMPIRNGFPVRLKGSLRYAVAPVVAISIVAVAFVAGNREVRQELSPLATPITESAPTAAGDGVMDVLVIPDASTQPIVDRLVAQADGATDLDVVVASPFSCSGVTEHEGSPICGNWLDEWPALIEANDPDVVLVYVSSWDAADIERVSGISSTDPEAITAWTEAVLGNGFGLLNAKGAPVAMARLPLTIAQSIQMAKDPFLVASQHLPKVDVAVRQVIDVEVPPDGDFSTDAFASVAIEAILRSLQLYQRAPIELPRVMVVGDSAARTFGYGLERMAADTGTAVVWTTATIGCGVADEGVVVDLFAPGGEAPVPPPCLAVRDGWREQIEQFDPDLVVVLSTVWDVQERKLPGWGEMRTVGDPAFDEYLLSEYEAAVDELTAGGASIVWIQGPCARSVQANGQPGSSTGSFDTARMRYLNDVILDRLVDARPEVQRFDLFPVLCPDGEFVESLGGVAKVRPDGVHFSTEGSLWVANEVGPEIFALGLAR